MREKKQDTKDSKGITIEPTPLTKTIEVLRVFGGGGYITKTPVWKAEIAAMWTLTDETIYTVDFNKKRKPITKGKGQLAGNTPLETAHEMKRFYL